MQLLLFGDSSELGPTQAGVDEHRVGAERGGSDHDLDHAAVVAAEDPDSVAGPQSRSTLEPMRQPVRAADERSVGEGTPLVNERSTIGRARRRSTQLAGERVPPGAQRHDLPEHPIWTPGLEQPSPCQRGEREGKIRRHERLSAVVGPRWRGRSRGAGSRWCPRRSCRSSRRDTSARPGARADIRLRRGSAPPSP